MSWRARAVLCGLALGVTVASAQSTLSGVIRSGADSSVLAAAEVSIPQLDLRATTTEKGKYRFESIPAGRYLVLVRRLGFDSASVTLAFTGDDDVKKDFDLVMLAQPLPAVPVTGKGRPIGNPKLAQFEERRRFGIGRFLTEADLERYQDKLFSNALANIPGIRIVTGKPVSRVAGGGLAAYVASSRGAFSIETQSAFFGSKCPVAIWLDGLAVYRGNDQVAVTNANGAFSAKRIGMDEPPYDINQIATRQVAALEFYSGPAQIPAQFNATQGTCGALIIWTK